ncbi:MAG: hypothetical protein ABI811_10535 [Acidobacteriota bacterium]
MAEFRKVVFALAFGALLAGTSTLANAQTSICQSNAGVPPIVREESFADLVGDVVLDCTGGISTPAGQSVPAVNFTVTLSTNITSRLLSGGLFSEALLIIDEPNSAINPARPLLACGDVGAPDTSLSGPGVCGIIATANPLNTYSGTTAVKNATACVIPATPTAADFGCGRPNVFQGRQGVAQNANQTNIIVFNGVPFDPPGPSVTNDQGVLTERHRFLRFTNIRANSPSVSPSFQLTQIVMNIGVNGNNLLAINNPQQIVAYVQKGLQPTSVGTRFDFVQCIVTSASNAPSITFREGFASSFKTKGFEHILANGTFDGSYYRYTAGAQAYPAVQIRQNVPGAIYNTESGFTSSSAQVNPAPNPPNGVGTTPVTGGTTLSNGTGIASAGIATQGTRLAVTFRDVPAGLSVSLPATVNLVRSGTAIVTGVAVRTITDANGIGAFSAAGGIAIGTDLVAVYEILFSDPFALEDMLVPIVVSYTPNLPSNQPEPGKIAQVAGGFAPFVGNLSVNTWSQASSTLPVPRFRSTGAFANLFSVSKCSCNILFPFVTNAASIGGNFDTGIAIANTSANPGTAFGFSGQAQQGSVQFWYYPSLAAAPPVPTQCTNTASPGTCPGTKNVLAGETLTYVLSQGSSTWGLLNTGAGFTGYVIAQTSFQYCHAFAYISPQGAGPLTPGMSVGYLGLILDKDRTEDALASRTNQLGEALSQ